jgi:hypothetical protein
LPAAAGNPPKATLSCSASEPRAGPQAEPWRALVRSAPLNLSSSSAYSFSFEARTTGANVTARLALQDEESTRPLAARAVELGPAWRRHSLRLVQPREGAVAAAAAGGAGSARAAAAEDPAAAAPYGFSFQVGAVGVT